MNIYLLEPKTFEGMYEYSHYTECLVIAESENEAKKYHPLSKHRWSGINRKEPWESKEWGDWRNNIDWDKLTEPTFYEKLDNWVNNLDDLTVTLIGTAKEGIAKGVVISSHFSYG